MSAKPSFKKLGFTVLAALTIIGALTVASIRSTNVEVTGNTTSTTAVIQRLTVGQLTVTSTGSFPGALTSTYPLFTTGNLLATSTFSAQQANVTTTLAVGGVSTLQGVTFTQATGTVSLAIGSGGTPLKGIYRTTASVDVNSMGIGQSTTSLVTLTGASVGDHCSVNTAVGDFLSTTSTGIVRCAITSTNVATLYFYNTTSGSAYNAGASTFSLIDFVF